MQRPDTPHPSKTMLTAITSVCSRGLHYDMEKQYHFAVKEYGNCIGLIGQYMSTYDLQQEEPNQIQSIFKIANQCIHRSSVIFEQQQQEQQQKQDQPNRQPTPTLTFTAHQLPESLPSYFTMTKAPIDMSLEELQSAITQIDEDREDVKKRVNIISGSPMQDSDYDTVKQLTRTMERLKMDRYQLEQYLRIAVRKREYRDTSLKRFFSAGSSGGLLPNRRSMSQMKRISVCSKHYSSPNADKLLEIIVRYFDFKNCWDAIDVEEQFLVFLASVQRKDDYIRQHLNSSAKKLDFHPLATVLQKFAELFKEEFDQSSLWLNVKEAVATIKTFCVQLSEVITNQWIAFDPSIRSILYIPDEDHARKELEEKGSMNGYLVWQSIVDTVVGQVYDQLLYVYAIQSQNQLRDAQLRKLSMLSLQNFEVADQFCPLEGQVAYSRAIDTLKKISRYVGPDDQLAVILKAHIDLIEEAQSYSTDKGVPFEGFSQHECPIALYVLLKAKVDQISCILSYVEDFMDNLDEESSRAIQVFKTAIEWSLEFNPEEWAEFFASNEVNDQQQLKTQEPEEQSNIYPSHGSDLPVDDDDLQGIIDDGNDDDDALLDEYLDNLDLDGIDDDSLQTQLANLMSSESTNNNKVNAQQLEEMKRSLAEKDKLLEDMAKEREQLISDYTNYISHLQSQINNSES